MILADAPTYAVEIFDGPSVLQASNGDWMLVQTGLFVIRGKASDLRDWLDIAREGLPTAEQVNP